MSYMKQSRQAFTRIEKHLLKKHLHVHSIYHLMKQKALHVTKDTGWTLSNRTVPDKKKKEKEKRTIPDMSSSSSWSCFTMAHDWFSDGFNNLGIQTNHEYQY